MITATLPVFRFAPSPNGRLHLGHAYSALLNYKLAQKTYGRFLLRMEDIDITRCTPEFTKACIADLQWLGLRWETPVRIQSEHWADYIAATLWLKKRGLIYPCFCTRSEIAARATETDPDGAPLYPGTCAHLSLQESTALIQKNTPHAWRLHMGKALLFRPAPHHYLSFDPATMKTTTVTAHPARWGDALLVRKDIPTSYHLSVVLDDAIQGITHIVRGKDLEAATDLHIMLQSLLGLPTPHYHHHPLITDGEGKLSKSKGSETLADLRARGVTAENIRKMIGF